jgi:hypothetical protein
LWVLQDCQSVDNTRDAYGWLSTARDAPALLACVVSRGPEINTRGDDVTRRWTVRLTAGLVAATAVLTGCSEKQPANETLPTQTAAETTPELPPLGPEDMPMPDEARTQDAAGAEAFVRYYIELINRTSTVMDAEPLREFSDGCRECDRLATNVEEAAAAGKDYENGEITITKVGQPVTTEVSTDLPITVDQAEFVVLDAAGVPTDGGSEPYSDIPGGIALGWDEARVCWVMRDLTFG